MGPTTYCGASKKILKLGRQRASPVTIYR